MLPFVVRKLYWCQDISIYMWNKCMNRLLLSKLILQYCITRTLFVISGIVCVIGNCN